MLKPSVLWLVLLSALIPLIAQAPATPPSRLQAIMRDFEAEGFSGVVLVERRGTLEFLQAYGYADPRRKIRNTPDTRFEMASLTKPFTAAAILKLQEQGKLRTSDRLDRYIGPLNLRRTSRLSTTLRSTAPGWLSVEPKCPATAASPFFLVYA
jgi:CubicO group peptidase (beta-lactamase class C family)